MPRRSAALILSSRLGVLSWINVTILLNFFLKLRDGRFIFGSELGENTDPSSSFRYSLSADLIRTMNSSPTDCDTVLISPPLQAATTVSMIRSLLFDSNSKHAARSSSFPKTTSTSICLVSESSAACRLENGSKRSVTRQARNGGDQLLKSVGELMKEWVKKSLNRVLAPRLEASTLFSPI